MRIVRFFLLYCFAVSLASFAAAFVRERESRDYMPTYGPYRHKSDITEEMMDEWACYGEGIQPNVYFTMMETVPETSGLGFDPKDLTCGGEFVIPCDRRDLVACLDFFRVWLAQRKDNCHVRGAGTFARCHLATCDEVPRCSAL